MTKLAFFVAQGLLAFLPALLVLLVSWESAERAGDLSVALGVVGAIFSIAYFGQRAYVAIRGFDAIPFREAMSFLVRISFEAEQRNHHPEIYNVYKTVELALTTHDAGNKVTALDVELAAAIEELLSD